MRIDNFLKDNIIVLVCVELHCALCMVEMYILLVRYEIFYFIIFNKICDSEVEQRLGNLCRFE